MTLRYIKNFSHGHRIKNEVETWHTFCAFLVTIPSKVKRVNAERLRRGSIKTENK